jgi:hypothetical protein
MRISINLTQAVQTRLARLRAKHPMASRAALAAYVLDAGFAQLLPDEGIVFHEEPAERVEQALDARDHRVGNAPDMSTFNPAVTAVTAVTAAAGSADPDDSEAYFEKLSSSPGGIAANPFE